MDEVMKDTAQQGVTEDMIREWKTRYGKVYKLAADDEEVALEVYIKKPTRAAIARFQSGVSGKKSVSAAAQQFVFDLLLYPEQDTLVKIFDEKPGLPTAMAGEIGDIVGITANFTTTEL